MPFGFDEVISDHLDEAYKQILSSPTWTHTDQEARLAVLSLNLRALANNFLAVDSAEVPLELDLKKVALGLLGTADFAESGISPGVMEY